MGVKRGELAQQQDVVAVIFRRFLARRIDDQRAVMPLLLLKPRMRVIPVGPRLSDGEFVSEGLPRTDSRKADPRHPVHVERHQEPVPVDRGIGVEHVGDVEADILALPKPDQRPRHRAVDRNPMAFPALHHARAVADDKIDDAARNLVEADFDRRAAAHTVHGVALRPRRQRSERRSGAGPCKQAASGDWGKVHAVYTRDGRAPLTASDSFVRAR